MKRFIVFASLILSVVALSSCANFECDICGEEKTGKTHKEELFGETITYCDDCYEDLRELANMFN